MDNFELRFQKSFGMLVNLLGQGFSKITLETRHPVFRFAFKTAEHSQKQNSNQELRDASLAQLEAFVSDLVRIKDYDKLIFRGFKNALKKCNDNTFPGIRFEVRKASVFIEKSLKFKKGESPDFSIFLDKQSEVFIECGSCHLSKEKDGDLKYKIGAVINEKTSHKYPNKKTALFINGTNIYFHSNINQTSFNSVDLEDFIKPFVKKVNSAPY
jgi:hypothetical protein